MKNPWRLLVRVFTRTLLVALALVVLLAGTGAALLGTSAGLGWLIRQADGLLPGSVKVAYLEGGLFGQLHVKQLSYRAPDMEADVDEIILRWFPAELFGGTFHLAELSVVSPAYTQLVAAEPETVPEASGSAVELPDISLPLDLLIDKVAIRNLQYRAEPDAEPVVVTRALLAAEWNSEGVGLQTLELEMPGVGLSANGALLPQGRYPLDLQTAFSLAMPDAPKTDASGRIHGDLGKLNIEQDLSGDVQAALKAIVEQPLANLRWQMDLDLQGFLLQSVTPENEGRVAGNLSARGDLARAEATGQLRLEDAEAFFSPWHTDLDLTADLKRLGVELRRFGVTRPDTPLELVLSGTADADLNFDLSGRWNALQWPPSGAAQFSSESGSLALKGTAEDYGIQVDAKVAGTDVPQGVWTLRGRGNKEQFAIAELKGETLGGTLAADGKVSWAPAVSWDAALTAKGIDPGVHYPEWPGNLDLALSSKGGIKDETLDLTAVIDRLNGVLRERPLDGTGRVLVQGDEIRLEKLKLSSGSAVVRADGNLGKRSDLGWSLDIADLADLAPDASGKISGSGSVRGAMLEPSVEGTLAVDDMSFQDLAVKSMAAQIALDLSDKTASRVELRSEGIGFGAEEITSLALEADGRKRDHRLKLQMEHALASLGLKLQGAYDESATAWSGKLEDLGIRSDDFGDWQLEKPAVIGAAPGDMQLSELCLARDAGFLCARGELKNEVGGARIDAEGLQLGWLKPFLPPEIAQLDGTLALNAEAKLDKLPTADVRLSIAPGKIVVDAGEAEDIVLDYQGGQVNASLGKKALAATFKLDIGDDGLDGRVDVPRAPLDKDPASAPLDGELHLQFRQFELLAGLVPAIEDLAGDLYADLKLGGRLGQPSVRGDAGLEMARIFVPDVGLDMKDLSIKASSADGKRMRLDGGVASSEGRLALAGDIELDAAKNWPMLITVKGENFRALDLPQMNALVSTDLAFESDDEGMVLKGTVEIPQAYLELDEIPEGSIQSSSDVIVVTSNSGEDEAPTKGAPFAMHVTVLAGDDVLFRGLGLEAYFEGKLSVDQIPNEFPTGTGEIRIKEGTFRAYGQDLVIERGIVAFSGGRIDNPSLLVRASREARIDLNGTPTDVKAGVDVTGTARKPELTVFSEPAMEERDAMAVLITGNTAQNFGQGTGSIGIDTQVTDKLSVGAELDQETSSTEFVTKYRINRKLHVEATTGSRSSAADVFYSLEFD